MKMATDVAMYIVNYANDNGFEISNLKLQKLLYYVQAAFLMESSGKDACFLQKIVAWLHGPVVENVYYEFSKYGGGQIPKQDTIRKLVLVDQRFEFADIPFDGSDFDDADREIIDKVLSGLLPFGAWDLVKHTHEEKPWIEAKDSNAEITKESIYEYFATGRNRERIYGKFD